MTGYVFTVAESVVTWKVELQDTVVLSTTETEYMAVIEATKEALWLKELVGIFRFIHDQFRSTATVKVRYISLRIIGITSI